MWGGGSKARVDQSVREREKVEKDKLVVSLPLTHLELPTVRVS